VHTTFSQLYIAILLMLRDRVFLQFRSTDLVMPKSRFACDLDFGDLTGGYSFIA
jgi:hypothetical protein